MRIASVKFTLLFLLVCALTPPGARADVLVDQTKLVATAAVAAPAEYAFTVATAAALTVTLTDFKAPAAFSSLQIAVTLGDALVGTASVDYAQGAATATVAVPAAAGNYTLRVIGAPDATQGFGTFGVCVSSAADSTNTCIAADSFSGTLDAPAAPTSTGVSTLTTTFTPTVTGTYTVTLVDDAFPAALQTLGGGITQGSTPVAQVTAGVPATVALVANTPYELLIGATADAATNAGLYSVRIVDPNGAVYFDHAVAVGALDAATAVANPSAQNLSLTLADQGYPASLTGLGAAVTSGSARLAVLTAAGSVASFAAPAGSLQVWTYAAAGTQPGIYALVLASTGSAPTSLLSTTRVVNPTGGASAASYAFVVPNLVSGSTYNLAVTDLKFPSALQSLGGTVAQGGVALPVGASGDFTPGASGSAVIVVNAQASGSGSGIFDVAVTDRSGATPQTLLDQTQAVGGSFTTQDLSIGTAGAYDVVLADLAFPAAFANLDVALSQGGQMLGSIYGAGTFPVSLAPGQYRVTIIATPAASGFGLYSLHVASSAPAVTFTAGVTSVTTGQPVQLTWSSQNATACSAAGVSGWSGNVALSGSTGVTITANSTLTLTCTGPGGSTTQSLNIAATPAAAGGGSGGGGALGWGSIGMLIGLTTLRVARRRR